MQMVLYSALNHIEMVPSGLVVLSLEFGLKFRTISSCK